VSIEHRSEFRRLVGVTRAGVGCEADGRFAELAHKPIAILLEPLVVEQQRLVELGDDAIERLARQNLAGGARELRLDVEDGVVASEPLEDGDERRRDDDGVVCPAQRVAQHDQPPPLLLDGKRLNGAQLRFFVGAHCERVRSRSQP
jgi:hypothetical protein